MHHYFIPFYGQIVFQYRYATFCLFIHQLMDVWVNYIFLAILNTAGVGIHYKFLRRHMFSILLGIHLGMEFLGHTVTLCLKI